MSGNVQAIAIMEARDVVDPAAPLAVRLRAAMRKTYRHWMCTDEGEQFMAAIEAVYASASEDEQERIKAEVQVLSALLGGGSPLHVLDVDALTATMEGLDAIGLRTLWDEVKADA